MSKESAGLLVYRVRPGKLEFLLVHPGGPFWKKKDLGVWSIPKGEIGRGEEPLECACREVNEELGFTPQGTFQALKPIQQKSGKLVHAWAVEGDFDTTSFKSNTFTLEWPPRSGQRQQFPEVDRAEYFELELAKQKINPAQVPFLQELVATRQNSENS